MTPDNLRAIADDPDALLEVSVEFISDLARLCAELVETATNVFGYFKPETKVGGVDEAPSVKRLADALASFSELKAP